MCNMQRVLYIGALLVLGRQAAESENVSLAIKRTFAACHKRLPDFDSCIKLAFNKIRPYFKYGIPELGVAPFDPHHMDVIIRDGGEGGLHYSLTLRDVFERGWSRSSVVKYKTDWKKGELVFSQYFPEKWLNGEYEFNGGMFGLNSTRIGRWNLTLRDYSQTTRIRRRDDKLDVKVQIDHLGDMEIHITNLIGGRSVLENVLDRIINASWKPGFAVVRQLINEMVSSAFTDIWSQSFRNFPLSDFIQD